MTKFLALVTASVASIALMTITGCGRAAKDYRNAAQKTIGGADAARVIGQEFTNISCELPTSTAKGSTFTCTATGKTNAKTYTLTATIVNSSKVEITDWQSSG